MPVHTVGDQRWAHTGHNSAGDRVYTRSLSGAAAYGGYEGWTKDELAAELEKRGLPKSGNKDELIARLEEDDG